MQTSASTLRGRKPDASVALLECLGKNVDLHKAMRSSRLYADDDPAIEAAIRRLIANGGLDGSYVLETEEII